MSLETVIGAQKLRSSCTYQACATVLQVALLASGERAVFCCYKVRDVSRTSVVRAEAQAAPGDIRGYVYPLAAPLLISPGGTFAVQ
jgi:hypothetical protein